MKKIKLIDHEPAKGVITGDLRMLKHEKDGDTKYEIQFVGFFSSDKKADEVYSLIDSIMKAVNENENNS